MPLNEACIKPLPFVRLFGAAADEDDSDVSAVSVVPVVSVETVSSPGISESLLRNVGFDGSYDVWDKVDEDSPDSLKTNYDPTNQSNCHKANQSGDKWNSAGTCWNIITDQNTYRIVTF